ncbi:MAG: DNA internalization-related competence protein ComEC/Rec2 [Oscillospiraceae bacterium]|nr:DNA internalization-related competence protein ComEC/Rec2 [Oscillospiraceae bacterium]
MRKLVWIAVGFCGGCALVAYTFPDTHLLPAVALAVVAGILCIVFRKQKIALACLGLMIGVLYTYANGSYYLRDIKAYDETVQPLVITVTDYSTQTDYGLRVEGEFELADKTYDIVIYCDRIVDLKPGDRLEGKFQLRLTMSGGSKETPYLESNGIYFIGYSRGEMDIFLGSGEELRFFPQRLRQSILNRLEKIFPEDTDAFAKALLLGDTTDLSYEQDIAMKTTGIRHIVATSGLHVSILFSLIYLLSGKMRAITALLGIPILILFAFVAGLSPSILRATVMQIVMILAMLLRREYDPPSALAVSVIVILLISPFSVTSASFQLSCGCVLGIFLFVPRLQNYIRKKIPGVTRKAKTIRAVLSVVSVSVSTMIITAPLCALYFGNISIIGVFANLLTLWAVSFIFYGIVLALILSFLWLPLGGAVAYVCSLLICYVLFVADLLQHIPLAAVYTASPYIAAWLITCYAVFAVFWFRGRKHHGIAAASMAVLLLAAVTFSYIEPRLDDYRITVLDVGQGQCILLQSRGETYMVDCGGSSEKETAEIAVSHLLSQGIRRIDGVILTHCDRDHIGALSYFLKRISVENLYLPVINGEVPVELPKDQKVSCVNEMTQLPVGVGQITAIPGKIDKDGNADSICILFQAADYDILIMGDRDTGGEADLLEDFSLSRVDALVIGHHGSAYATGLPLLQKTKPETAIISVGKNNAYGHPSADALERLNFFGCRILRTDKHGTIIIRG